MDKGLINQTIQYLHLENEKSLLEVKQYLSMKYRIDLEVEVIEKRLGKMIQEEKAVA